MNVDALQLMKAQDPAQKLDMLRKAFFRTGRSVESMTLQERKYLAQQTGLDDASIGLAFSLKNQGMSYDQVTKKGDLAKKNQLTQAQALQKLAGAIERIVQSGSDSGGFFDRFFKGFATGIRWTRDFRRVMMNLRRTLHMTKRAGIETGRAFVHAFPGVKEFFAGLAGFFDPSRFRRMLRGVVNSFKQFFNDVAGNRPGSFPDLLERLKRTFFNWFDANSPAGRKFLAGTKKILGAFALIANGVLKTAIEGLTKGIQFIIGVLSGRISLTGALSALGEGGGFLGVLFSKLMDGLEPLAKNLWTALKKLFQTVFDKLKPVVSDILKWWLYAIFSQAVLVGALRGFGAALAAAASESILGALKKTLFTKATTEAVNSMAQTASQTAAVPTRGVSAAVGGVEQVTTAAQSSKVSRSAIPKLLGITAVIVIAIMALLYAIKDMALFIKDNDITLSMMASTVMALGATAGIILAAAGTVKMVTAARVSVADLKSMLGALVPLGIVVGAMILTAWTMLSVIKAKSVTMEMAMKTALVMAAVSAVFLAASGVAAIALFVGTAVVATKGLGIAAIIAGLVALGVVVAAMIVSAESIALRINRFQAGPGFAEKATAFIGLIRAIGEFSRGLGSIMSAVTPSIMEVIGSALFPFGKSPSERAKETFGRIREIIDAIGGQITSIINTIMRHAQEMSPEQVRRGTVIAETLTTVADLARALSPALEHIHDPMDFRIFKLFEPSQTAHILALVQSHISVMVSSLGTVMANIRQALFSLSSATLSDDLIRATKIFVVTLKAVTDFAKAIIPTPELIRAMKGAGGPSLTAISSVMLTTIGTLITGNLFQRLGEYTKTVVEQLRGLSDRDVAKIRVLMPLLTSAFSALTSVASLVSTALASQPEQLHNLPALRLEDNDAITSRLRATQSITRSLETFLPNVITSLSAIPLSAGIASGLAGKTKALTLIFGLLSRVGEIYRGFSVGDRLHPGIVYDAVSSIAHATKWLFDPADGNSKALRAGLTGLGTLPPIPRDVGPKLEVIKNMFQILKDITESTQGISDMTTRANDMAEQIKGNTITRIVTSIRDMVTEVNRVSEELNGITVPNLNIGLRRLAADVGLGETGNLTIRHRNFNVNVNVNVTIDSRDLHDTLVVTARNPALTNRPRLATN